MQALRASWPRRDFLMCATPGAGKTTGGLAVAHRMLDSGFVARVVVVTPTAHLAQQWSVAAASVGIDLEPNRSSVDGLEPADRHGISVTYQAIAAAPEIHARFCTQRRTLVILDEPHHAGDESTWGAALGAAFAATEYRLLLTGTPWRSDGDGISFARYVDDECVPDYTYGYRDALRDGVVRPVQFHIYEGDVSWRTDRGERRASFADNVSKVDAARRLRSAISGDGDWLASVMTDAMTQLDTIRAGEDPAAAALVVCESKAHAEVTAAALGKIRGHAVPTVTSDQSDASKRLAEFRSGRDPALCAVKMVSEGVDVPRIRVIVWATVVRTELAFAQIVGRGVRWIDGIDGDQIAHVFMPADPALKAHARRYDEARRYHLRARALESRDVDTSGRQTSSFQALSGSAELEEIVTVAGRPAVAAASTTSTALAEPPTPSEQRDRARTQRRALIARLAKARGISHAEANGCANRAVGIRSVKTATADQIDAANRWLRDELQACGG